MAKQWAGEHWLLATEALLKSKHRMDEWHVISFPWFAISIEWPQATCPLAARCP